MNDKKKRTSYTQTGLRENVYKAIRQSEVSPVAIKYYKDIVAYIISSDFYDSVIQSQKTEELINISKDVVRIISEIMNVSRSRQNDIEFAYWCIGHYDVLVDFVETRILEARERGRSTSEIDASVLYNDIKSKIRV